MPVSDVHVAAPAALGVNVLRHAPIGAVQLTQPQRDEILRELDALRAQSHEFAERLESLLIATAPGLTTHLDHEKDEARALLSRTKAGCLAQRPTHG